MRSSAGSRFLTIVTATSLASCGSTAVAVFHVSDPTFQPSPGAKPPVYLTLDPAGLPHAQMRSVGLIEVTVPESRGREGAAEVAADKGAELGCWIVVEHEAFARLRASRDHDARIVLVHSGASHISHAAPPARRTVRFDCVLQVTSATTWVAPAPI